MTKDKVTVTPSVSALVPIQSMKLTIAGDETIHEP